MKIAIVVFPGSNCDRDISCAIKKNIWVQTRLSLA